MGWWTTLLTAYRRIDGRRIPSNALVIDVGSGSHPNPRAHVACDGLEDDQERDAPLLIDRPFVWADVQRLPFRDGAFGYAICSHVLEHVPEPGRLLDELQRIASAGYIETPSAASEYLIPYTYHLSRVTLVEGPEHTHLSVCMKPTWDDTFPPPYSDVLHDMKRDWWRLYAIDPRHTLTQFWWTGRIPYKVSGECLADKPKDIMSAPVPAPRSLLRRLGTTLVYWSLTPRLSRPLESFLICPHCHAELRFTAEIASCASCHQTYGRHRGHWDFRIPLPA